MSKRNLVLAVVLSVSLFLAAGVQGQTTWYVDCDDCTPPGTGTPGDPFCSIQDGINAASNTDTVLVSPGLCNEVINFNGKPITLQSTDPDDPAVVAATIIDGTGFNDSVAKCISDEGSGTVLQGFTIRGGTGDAVFPSPGHAHGGGMLNVNSSPKVIRCVFTQNHVSTGGANGGGMANWGGSNPTVSDCTFTANTADRGGGMCNDNSNPSVIGCTFSGNTATGNGGGMCNRNGSGPWVVNCMFNGNEAEDGGGLFNNINSSPIVLNCTFSSNAALDGYNPYGGGVYNGNNSDPEITNCTFSGNTAGLEGGGIASLVDCHPAVTDCIFWQNSDNGGTDESAQVHDDVGSVSAVSFSCIQGCTTFCSDPSDHNIGDDPLFVSGPDGDSYLSQVAAGQGADSPCVDSGCCPASVMYMQGTTRTDHVGDTNTVDMGFHYDALLWPQHPIPTVSEWGMVAMTLLVFAAGAIVFARMRRQAA